MGKAYVTSGFLAHQRAKARRWEPDRLGGTLSEKFTYRPITRPEYFGQISRNLRAGAALANVDSRRRRKRRVSHPGAGDVLDLHAIGRRHLHQQYAHLRTKHGRAGCLKQPVDDLAARR